MDGRNADFSGRLGSENRSYVVPNRRRRRVDGSYAPDVDLAYGDFSDEEDETIDRRFARLKRDLEELRMEVETGPSKVVKERDGKYVVEPDTTETTAEDVSKLSEALDLIYPQRLAGAKNTQADFLSRLEKSQQVDGYATKPRDASKEITDIEPQLSQALLKTAEFEARLAGLEAALGLTGSNLVDQGASAPKPIIPLLNALDRQVQIITTGTSSLEGAQSKTRQLIKDAERVQRLREANEEEDDHLHSRGVTNGHTSIDAPEQVSKINALYGTLSTIDNLSPSLQMVLERLRTLRALHTSAAVAGTSLDDMEKRQAEQAAEIEQWKEALQTVESQLKDGQSSLKENVEEMEKWVKDVESRLAKFS